MRMSCSSQEVCFFLTGRVKQVKPLIHVFGHIHENRGVMKPNDPRNPNKETTFINASWYFRPRSDELPGPWIVDVPIP